MTTLHHPPTALDLMCEAQEHHVHLTVAEAEIAAGRVACRLREEHARTALLFGASVLEGNIRESDPPMAVAGIEACVEILRRLAAGEVPA